jgi:hypothetical protein
MLKGLRGHKEHLETGGKAITTQCQKTDLHCALSAWKAECVSN